MNAISKLCSFILIAILGGCAQTSALSQLTPFGSGDEAETTASIVSEEAGPENGPPLPVKNAFRGSAGKAERLASSSEKAGSKQAGLSLGALSDVKLFTATAYAPAATQWDDKPIGVYTKLAQQIHACWFKPGAPKLIDHGFHAEVAPNNPSEAKIIIYKKDPNGKRGLQAFRISIDSSLNGATVTAENRRLDKKLDESFRTDLARWSKGNSACAG
jgi:hypothetical protein